VPELIMYGLLFYIVYRVLNGDFDEKFAEKANKVYRSSVARLRSKQKRLQAIEAGIDSIKDRIKKNIDNENLREVERLLNSLERMVEKRDELKAQITVEGKSKSIAKKAGSYIQSVIDGFKEGTEE